MYSVPEETGSDEPDACNSETEAQRLLRNYSAAIATFAAAYVATIIIAIIVSRMWNEDEIRLHILDALIRILQTIARFCGGWALACEKAYGDYVNALH